MKGPGLAHPRALLCLAAAIVALVPLPGCQPYRPLPTGGLVYAGTTQPNSLSPLTSPDIVSRGAVELVFDGLVDVNERLEIVPALARSWQVSADGLSWTFELRRGVRFHDGTPFTSADVTATYDAILDPGGGSTLPRSDYAGITRVEAPDEQTVRFTLQEPDASLLSKLTVGICAASPRRLAQDGILRTPAPTARCSVGTGPFILQEWRPGQHLLFAANPDYYAGPPGLATLTWEVVPDPASLLVLLQNSEADGALVETPEEAAILTALPSPRAFTAYAVTGGNAQISLQMADDLFQDVRVRQALALALDRRAMLAGLLGGQGILSAGDILPISWAYNPQAAELYPYDPAQARALLEQAGWRPGPDGALTQDRRRLAFTLSTDAGSRLRREIALTVRQQWRQIGADVDVAFVERNTFVVDRVLKGQFQAALLQSSVRVDPDLSRRFHSRAIQSGQNFLGYRNPLLDELLDTALRAPDAAQRAPLYQQAQMLLARDVPQINLFYPTAFYCFRNEIQGLKPSATSLFWNVQEWRR